jgi:hypothetical protein
LDTIVFVPAKNEALEIIKSLRWHLDRQDAEVGPSVPDGPVLDGSSLEADLWEHVRSLVTAEEWEKIPREAAVFVENKLREWADFSGPKFRGSAETFKIAVNDSHFTLGGNASESQGWQQIFGGFALAIRNNAGHKLVERAELRRYAVAVLGTASLLLGQIRHQYGDPPEMRPGIRGTKRENPDEGGGSESGQD